MNQYVKCPFCFSGYADDTLTRKCVVCNGSGNAEVTGYKDETCRSCCHAAKQKKACIECGGVGVVRLRVFRNGWTNGRF